MFRVAIFIDGGYMDKVLRNEFGGVKISYDRLACEIAYLIRPDLDVLRTYYYHCLPYKGHPPTRKESKRFGAMQSFLESLDRLPRFEVREGRLARRGPDEQGRYHFEQKMVDVLLSVDLVRLSTGGQVSHAALVAGDSDFVPAVQAARNAGVSVWLFHGEYYHNELWKLADERIRINPKLVEKVRWVGR